MPLVEELLRVKNLRKIYLLDNTEEAFRKTGIAKEKARAEQEKAEAKAEQEKAGMAGAKETLAKRFGTKQVRYMAMPENLGYGRAHNIALRESAYYQTELHLVMNSDIRVKAEDIDAMHDWMTVHPEAGQLIPKVLNPDGTQQYLAKRLPSPIDVFGRRFLPKWMIAKRNKRYELRDLDLKRPVNAPYLSGCFMLLRTKAAVEAGLFDERYFMYPEDIDLTRTIHRHYLTLYYPEWTIIHAHAQASYKDTRMLRIHIQNMCRYFNKWGWFFDRERKRFNQIEHL